MSPLPQGRGSKRVDVKRRLQIAQVAPLAGAWIETSLNDEIDRHAAIICFNNDFHLLMMLVMAIFPMLLVLKAPTAGKR